MSGNEHAADGMMLVLSTFPDIETAREIGSGIVAEGLAACVNLVPQMESIYRWKGELKSESEVLAIFKLSSMGFPELEVALTERHPYEVPEIVGLPVDAVSRSYLDWVLGRTPPC